MAAVIDARLEGAPTLCTAQGMVLAAPLEAGWDSFTICRGTSPATIPEALQLDVDRYPTIVEVSDMRLTSKRGLRMTYADKVMDSVFFYSATSTVRSTSGRLLSSETKFSVPTHEGILEDSVPKINGPPHHFREQGGWRAGVVSGRLEQLVGLVFLPTMDFTEKRALGCPEGHVVWLDTAEKRAFADDVRRIIGAPDPEARSFLENLRREGGRYAGMYAAEHLPWREAVALLDDADEPNLPFVRGLARGVLRMRTLHFVPSYPRPHWKDVDLGRVEAALGRWALRVVSAEPLDRDVLDVLEAIQARYEWVGEVPGAAASVEAIRAKPWVSDPRARLAGSPWPTSEWSPHRSEAFRSWLLGTGHQMRADYHKRPRSPCNYAGGVGDAWRALASAHIAVAKHDDATAGGPP